MQANREQGLLEAGSSPAGLGEFLGEHLGVVILLPLGSPLANAEVF